MQVFPPAYDVITVSLSSYATFSGEGFPPLKYGVSQTPLCASSDADYLCSGSIFLAFLTVPPPSHHFHISPPNFCLQDLTLSPTSISPPLLLFKNHLCPELFALARRPLPTASLSSPFFPSVRHDAISLLRTTAPLCVPSDVPEILSGKC